MSIGKQFFKIRQIQILIMYLFLVCCVPVRFVSAESLQEMTLGQIIERVHQNNLELKSAFQNLKAAREVPGQVSSLPNPTLSLSHYVEEVETRVGPQKMAFAVEQRFPWWGTLKLKSAMADKKARIKESNVQELKNKLEFLAKSLYFDLYLSGKSLKITHEHQDLLKAIERHLQSKLKVGQSSLADLLKVQTELDRLEDREQSIIKQTGPLFNQLAALMGEHSAVKIKYPQEIRIDEPRESFAQLKEQLRSRNVEMRSLNLLTEQGQIETELAKKGQWPMFSLGFKQIQTDDALNVATLESGKDAKIVSLGMSLPIWRAKTKSRIREKEFQTRAYQYQKRNRYNWLVAELKKAFYQMNDSARKGVLYKERLIPKAEQTLEVIRKQFESGQQAFIDVLDTDRILLHYELEKEKTLTQRARAIAKIQYLIHPLKER